jgi:hypothetical protein
MPVGGQVEALGQTQALVAQARSLGHPGPRRAHGHGDRECRDGAEAAFLGA